MEDDLDANPSGSEADQPALSLDDAVALLEDEPPTGANVDEQDDAIEAGTPDEADEGQEAEDDDEDEAQADTDEEAEEDPDGDEEAEESEEDAEAAFVVKLKDGTELTAEQIETGYMHNYDYTKKTEALAQQRKEFEETTTQQTAEIQRQAAEMSSNLDVLAQYWEQTLPPAPDPGLAYTDQDGYIQQMALHNSAMQEFESIRQAQEYMKAEQQKHIDGRLSVLVSERDKQLLEDFPTLGLDNPDKRKNFDNDMLKTALSYGFSEEDFKNTLDPRVYRMAHDALLYRKSLETSKKVGKKAAKAAPVVRPGKRKPKPNIAKAKQQKALRQLNETGSIHDAMNVDFE